MAVPQAQAMGDFGALDAAIGSATLVSVYQSFYFGPPFGGISCCLCDVRNRFTAVNAETGAIVAEMFEDSPCCLRCWCAPDNSMFLRVILGDGQKSIPLDDVRSVLPRRNQLRKLGGDHNEATRALAEAKASYTIERVGCLKKPCLSCFACNASCQDEFKMYAGHIEGEPGEIAAGTPIVSCKQAPASEAMLRSRIDIRTGGSAAPSIYINGPPFFGGWYDLCCDTVFEMTGEGGVSVGRITKPKPANCMGLICACCFDFDRYDIRMSPELTPEQKAGVLTGAVMADYMFFERDPGPCTDSGDAIHCNFCFFYFLGCICPCKVVLPKAQN